VEIGVSLVRRVRRQAEEACGVSLQLLPIELPEDLEYADLVVLSDMHVGDPLFDEQLFFRVRDWVLAEPYRYVICNGDLMNTATKDSVSDVYRETLNPADQLRWLRKNLRRSATASSASRKAITRRGSRGRPASTCWSSSPNR
jgi:Archaeal DNA polymerase II, small subunit/DNA polymerase delta, subunit B